MYNDVNFLERNFRNDENMSVVLESFINNFGNSKSDLALLLSEIKPSLE